MIPQKTLIGGKKEKAPKKFLRLRSGNRKGGFGRKSQGPGKKPPEKWSTLTNEES